MTEPHRRRGRTSPAEVPLPDDDDLLREILVRLPPQPSSLPRASLVCKRWRGLVKDPRFLRRFRTHHGKPPLLGFFLKDDKSNYPFVPILKPPDRIHAERFTFPIKGRRHSFDFLDCRHGLVLLKSNKRRQVLIWDPITYEQCRVSIPPLHSNGEALYIGNEGVVRCVNGDQGHVHGHCHSGPFQVALVVGPLGYYCREFVCVYSSATGTWSDPVSAEFDSQVTIISEPMRCQGTLVTMVGDSLYWLPKSLNCILEYDFDRHNLAVIKLPPDVNAICDCVFTLMPAEDGGLGLILLSNFHAQLWKREADFDGAAAWVPGRTIRLGKLRSAAMRRPLIIVGFAVDNNVMLVWTASGVFIVDIQSTKKIEKLCNNSDQQVFPLRFYPFASFYGAGKSTAGRNDGDACCMIQQGT